MKTEVRFLLAIGLMLAVLVGTNVLFPPVVEEPAAVTSGPTTAAEAAPPPAEDPSPPSPAPAVGAVGGGEAPGPPAEDPAVELPPESEVFVEGPLYRYTFSTYGARLTGAELPQFLSLRQGNGPVELIPDGSSALGQRLVLDSDTVDLRRVPFEADPPARLMVREGDDPAVLRFVYRHPTTDFTVELSYTFRPEGYLVDVEGRVTGTGAQRPLLLTDLGEGLRFTEADSTEEARMMAYVVNHLQDGIDATPLSRVTEAEVINGPFLWTAFKSKFFVMAILSGHGSSEGEDDYLGGLILEPAEGEYRARVAVTQPLTVDGAFDLELFAGPLEYARLSALGDDLEEVNPYGYRFIRPIVRPMVGIIMFCLNFLHNTLSVGYGWVLILFGVLMRVLLWPLYMKSMRAQMAQMRVQPLLKDIQTRHKDNPERLQKEMMKLYKEHGFNPLAGCLPMLLPWPVLIALFFVFQNTIELRGVAFLWLPDLSAKDPFYILPIFLALSMFLLQFISFRSMEQSNPQMKMMMWIMPFFFGFIFMNFASGLNLYYATANIATIPQQVIVARERRKVRPLSAGAGQDSS
jgi:YidC/Oxa1 family membrane protein insertase